MLEAAIITDRWGVTRGFGFVTFKDEASMAAALAQGEEHSINGVSVEVKRSTHGEPESSTSRKVFVGGLGLRRWRWREVVRRWRRRGAGLARRLVVELRALRHRLH